MWAKKIVLIVMIIVLLQLHWHIPLRAQAAPPTLHTDCTAFPTCNIYLPTSAALSQPTLIANGEPVPESLYTVEEAVVGTAVAFAFHEYTTITVGSPGVLNPGATGEPRFVEFRNAVINFIDYAETAAWDAETYWLSVYKNGDTGGARSIGELPAIAEWELGLFRNEVYNKVNGYETSETKNTPIVPLYDLIDRTISAFDNVDPSAAHAEKALVVFSNGLLDGSTQDRDAALANNTVALDALLTHAAERGVTIHVVLLVTSVGGGLPSDLAATLRSNAEEIATPTGGQVVWLGENVALDEDVALSPIWAQIGQSRFQELISTSLLDLADSGVAPTALQVANGSSRSSVVSLALPTFQPPTITEAALAPAQWNGAETLTLHFQPAWADGYGEPTRLGTVRYVISDNGGAVVADYTDQAAPVTATTIPMNLLSALTDGTYMVSAQLTDKLFPTAPISTTIGSFTVVLPIPTAMMTTTSALSDSAGTSTTALLSATALTAGGIERGSAGPADTIAPSGANALTDSPNIAAIQRILPPLIQGLRPLGGILLWPTVGLLLLLVTIGSWRRWSDGRRQFDTIRTSDPPDNHTLPDDQTEPDIEGFPVARLIYDSGDGNLLPEIALYPGNGSTTQWTIGRSYQERDGYINHPRVSRYHALLLEKDGQFYIRHQGSSGGTYVNRIPLDALVDHRLQDGDLLHFSTAVAYRFQIEDRQPQSEQTEPALADIDPFGAMTEPDSQKI